MSPKQRVTKAVEPPDGGWGWVVVCGVFVTSALVFGSVITYPLFFLPLMQEFNVGLGDVTWLTGTFEIGKAFGYLAMPIFVAKLGYRGTGMSVSIASGVAISAASLAPNAWFAYILAGIIPGFTMGIFVTLCNVVVARYFVKRRLLALGLGQTGSAVGTLVLAPLLQYFIDIYGWRGGILLLGGLSFNSAVACSLFRPIRLKSDEEQQQQTSDNSKEVLASVWEVTKLPKIWLVCGIWLTGLSSLRTYIRFLVPYSQEVLGIEPMASSIVLSIYSVVSMFSRVGFGAFADRKEVKVLWVLIVTFLLTAVVSGTVWFVNSYAGLLVNSMVHSFSSAPQQTMYVSVIGDIVGESRLALGYTICGFIYSVVGSAMVPLMGMLVDSTGEIRLVFVAASILLFVSALLHIPLLYANTEHVIANHQKVCSAQIESDDLKGDNNEHARHQFQNE